jgi:hypothetical protein
VAIPGYELTDNVDYSVMWSGRKELVMKWKLLLKEGAVAYLRVVSKFALLV